MKKNEKGSRPKAIIDSICDSMSEGTIKLSNEVIQAFFQELAEKIIRCIKSKPDITTPEIKAEIEKIAGVKAVEMAHGMLDQSTEMGEYIYRTAITRTMKDLEWGEEAIQQILKLADEKCDFKIDQFPSNASNSHSKRKRT